MQHKLAMIHLKQRWKGKRETPYWLWNKYREWWRRVEAVWRMGEQAKAFTEPRNGSVNDQGVVVFGGGLRKRFNYLEVNLIWLTHVCGSSRIGLRNWIILFDAWYRNVPFASSSGPQTGFSMGSENSVTEQMNATILPLKESPKRSSPSYQMICGCHKFSSFYNTIVMETSSLWVDHLMWAHPIQVHSTESVGNTTLWHSTPKQISGAILMGC